MATIHRLLSAVVQVLPVSYDLMMMRDNLMMMRDNLMMMEVMMRDDEKISIGTSGRTFFYCTRNFDAHGPYHPYHPYFSPHSILTLVRIAWLC